MNQAHGELSRRAFAFPPSLSLASAPFTAPDAFENLRRPFAIRSLPP